MIKKLNMIKMIKKIDICTFEKENKKNSLNRKLLLKIYGGSGTEDTCSEEEDESKMVIVGSR
ncbi:hypothetical protein ATO12_01355 [Aquimarina atlantica]|uniref:Uncharacterized protein n=1 Tax=Aquimarina atlantica TaxID=1317122 RepID=A0A023BZR4_9FLAO|nr:hypothetical protein [Aquimarina atlantica]EZH75454.1 hypothetical protein ATO12_01355 [Aquimarina atlantica]